MTQIFVNLPVKNLPASKAFFEKLGYRFNPQFTNDEAACMVIEEGSIHVMLLTHAKFTHFAHCPPTDTSKSREVLICVSQPSREAVDRLVDAAIAAGAKAHSEPEDHGFMYSRNFIDLDGHGWETLWMDASKMAECNPG